MGTASVFSATIRLRDVFTSPLNRARIALENFTKAALRATGVTAVYGKEMSTLRGKLLAFATAQLSVTNELRRLTSGYAPYISIIKKINSAWVALRNTVYRGIGAGALGLFGTMAAGMLAVVRAGVRFNASMESNQLAFNQFLGSAQKATIYLKGLYDLAAKTPFSFPEVTKAARQLMAYGFSAQKTMKTLKVIADTVSAFGGGAQQIDEMTLALGQMQAKGVIQGQEILQLAQAGIPVVKILQKQLHLTGAQVGDIGKLGIKASVGINAILKGLNERFKGMSVVQSQTLSGLWSTLKDYFGQAAGAITKSLMPQLKQVTQRLITFTSYIGKVFGSKGSLAEHFHTVWTYLDTGFTKWYNKSGLATVRKWGHKIGKGLADLLLGSTASGSGGAFFNMGYAGVEALAHGFLTNLNALGIIFSPIGQFLAIGMATTVGPKLALAVGKMLLTSFLMRRAIQTAMGIKTGVTHPIKTAGWLTTQISSLVGPKARGWIERRPGGRILAERQYEEAQRTIHARAGFGQPMLLKKLPPLEGRTPTQQAEIQAVFAEAAGRPVGPPVGPRPGALGFLPSAYGQPGARRQQMLAERNATAARVIARAATMGRGAVGGAQALAGMPGVLAQAPAGLIGPLTQAQALAGRVGPGLPTAAGGVLGGRLVTGAVRRTVAIGQAIQTRLLASAIGGGMAPTPMLLGAGIGAPMVGPAEAPLTTWAQKAARRLGQGGRLARGTLRVGRVLGRLAPSGLGMGMALAGGLGMLTTGISGGFGAHPAMAALSAAATGAGIGSMVTPMAPMLGAAAGAIIGGITGALFSIFGKEGRKGLLVKTSPGDSLAQKMGAIEQGIVAQKRQNQADIQAWASGRQAAASTFGAGTLGSTLFGPGAKAPSRLDPRFQDPVAKATYTLWKLNATGVREQMELGARAIGDAIDPKHIAPFVRAMTYYLEAAQALAPKQRAGAIGEAARRAGIHAVQGVLHPGGRGTTPRFLDPVAQISAAFASQLTTLGTTPGQGRLNNLRSRRLMAVAMIRQLIPSLPRLGGVGLLPKIIGNLNQLVPGLDLNTLLASMGMQSYGQTRQERLRARNAARVRAARVAVAGVLPFAGGIPGIPSGIMDMYRGKRLKDITRADLSTIMPALIKGLRTYLRQPMPVGAPADSKARAQSFLNWLTGAQAKLPAGVRNRPPIVPGVTLTGQPLSPAASAAAAARAARVGDTRTVAQTMLDDYKRAVQKGAKPLTAAVQSTSVAAWTAISSQKVMQTVDEGIKSVWKRVTDQTSAQAPSKDALMAQIFPTVASAGGKTPKGGAGPPGMGGGVSISKTGPGAMMGQASAEAMVGAIGKILTPEAIAIGLFGGGGKLAGPLLGTPYKGTHTLGNWQSDNAIDVGMPIGSPIFALAPGTISKISMKTLDPSNRFAGYGITEQTGRGGLFYMHLSRSAVAEGQKVGAGTLLGLSGAANGVAHLHFGVQPPQSPYDYYAGGPPKKHGGGQFLAPSKGGEGYALLRDRERVLPASASNPAGAGGRPIIIHYHGEKAGPVDVKKIASELAGMIDAASRNYSSIGRRIDG